jgi:S1-C subfamily serine protease
MELHSKSWGRNAMLASTFLAVFAVALPAQAQARREVRVFTPGTDVPYLGVEMEDVTPDNMSDYKLTSERGVIVRSVEKGSPAQAANLQEKDVILEYAGMPVFSSSQFTRMVRETPPGRKVDLVVSRDGKRLTLSARTGTREGGSSEMGRNFEVLPDHDGTHGWTFRGPEGRTFQFHMPGGPGEAFMMPGGRAFSFAYDKPRLGVTLQPLTSQLADFLGAGGRKGVLVTSVTENSPAVGKLKAGDIILSADGHTIESPETLTTLLASKESQAKVELKIIRDKKEQTIVVELSKTDGETHKGGYRM